MLLSSCVQSDKELNKINLEEKQVENKDIQNQIPDVYRRSEDNIQFEAQVICPNWVRTGEIEIPQIELQLLEEDSIVDEVFKDISISKKTTDELLGEDGKTSKIAYYTGIHEESLSIQSYRVDYNTPFYRNYLSHAFDLERNAEKYSLDKQLAFFDTKTAWDIIKNMFYNMNVEIGVNPSYKSYVLDYQTLSSEEYVIDMNGELAKDAYKESWTEQDEGYYFCVWQNYQGVNIHCPNIEFINEYADFNSPVQILITQNEISYLSIGRTFIIMPKENKKSLVDLEKISDAVIKKLSMIITDAQYTVESMELCYYPKKMNNDKYEMTAVWILNIVEESPSGNESDFQMAIDAITAEELY